MAEKNEFTIVREFNAPRDIVWKAFTEEERLAKWWGPKGLNMLTTNLDLRSGGFFHYQMGTPDGQSMWGKFVYREITPPDRIVFVNSFSDKDRNVKRHPMGGDFPLEILITVTFTEQGNKTKLTLTGSPLNASAEEEKAFRDGFSSMQEGFGGTWAQLDEYLASLTSSTK